MKLLILADDLTGALDTGVQLAAQGAETKVAATVSGVQNGFPKAEVVVVNTESRHLPKDEAYVVNFRLAKQAREAGVPRLYVKTDSALRGNVGSTLAAVLDASGEASLSFVPAFPKMARVTRGGILFVDGLPVRESVFGSDPFEPVRFNAVEEIVHAQSAVETNVISTEMHGSATDNGVLIYDAETEEDLRSIARSFAERGIPRILAGCAGFAAMLPELLGLSKEVLEAVPLEKPFFIISGSLNPVTQQQLDYGKKLGFARRSFTEEQLLSKAFLAAESKKVFCEEIKQNEKSGLILCSERTVAQKDSGRLEEVRRGVSKAFGALAKQVMDSQTKGTLMVIGGDTLLGVMNTLGVSELTPLWEPVPGCVLSKLAYRGKVCRVLSKSGGFGEENLLESLLSCAEKQ